MRLLLIRNSTNPGESYVAHAKNQLKDFLREQKQNVIFIPYAVVTFLFDEKVNSVFDKVVGLQEGTMLQRNENNNQITII